MFLSLTIYLYDSLSKEEAGRANVAMAFTIESLYYILLKTQGIDPSNHNIKGELERIKPYIVKSGIGKKPQQQSQGPKGTTTTGAQETTARTMTVNKKAAQNFIRRSLV